MVLGIGGVTIDRIAVIPRMPEWDDICYTNEGSVQQGGMVATALVTAARLGVPARFIGGVGDDAGGEAVRSAFALEGVDTALMTTFPGETTAYSYVLVHRETGKRSIIHHRGVQERTALPLSTLELDGVAALHADGFWHETAVQLMKMARERGIVTIIDPSSRIAREQGEEIFPLCRYIMPSYHFAKKYTGRTEPNEMGEIFLRYGCRGVCITRGEEGCYFYTGKDRMHLPAYPVPVKDTTGAGDVFHGAFCAGLSFGYSDVEALSFAAATAALKCMKLGGQSGIPSLSEVVSFMKEHAR